MMKTEDNVGYENIFNNLKPVLAFEEKTYLHNMNLLDLKLSTDELSNEDAATDALIFTAKIAIIYGLIFTGFDVLGELIKNKIRTSRNISKREAISGFVRNKAKIELQTKELNFKDMSGKRFPAPVGLKVPLMTMGVELEKLGNTVFKDLIDALDTYSVLLSVAISDELERKSNKSIAIFDKKTEKKDKVINKVLSNLIKKGSSEDTKPLGFLIGNGKQVNDLLALSERLSNTYNPEIVEAINNKVEALSEKMGTLLKLVKEGSIKTMSKAVTQDLVNGSEAVAKYVSSVTALYYTYDQFSNSVVKIVKEVSKTK